MAGSGESDSRIPPGTRLNGIYIVERRIAVGGMGEIYVGRAAETGVPVAIKMIRPELAADPNVIALFRREALALHQLRHEAIVAYYVFTIDPDLNAAYLAMEYVPGRSLSDMAREGPLGFEFVRILQKRVASGLHAAHRAGLVHRDVSPDNILLPDGDPARAKIIDFGIAKNKLDKSTIIGDGFAGKNSYISPEQLGLFGGEVSAKSDVYSLGLVLAEALLGRMIDMGGNLAEVVTKRESVPDLTGIDRRMLPLLRQMLDPDPANRPAMDDVATREVTGLTPADAVARDATIVKELSRRAVLHDTPPEPPRNTRAALMAGGSLAAAALIAAVGYLLWPAADRAPAPQAPPPLAQTTPPALGGAGANAQAQQDRAREQAEAAAAAERQRQADLAAAEQRRAAQQQADIAAAAERQRQADLAAAEQKRIAQQQADIAAAAERQRQADLAAAEQQRIARQQADIAAAAERQRQADLAAAEQRRLDEARQQQAQRDQDAERRRLASQAIAEQQRQARERAEEVARADQARKAAEAEAQRRLQAEAEAARKPAQLASRTDAANPAPGMRDCSQCPDLVAIPEGSMRMGSHRDPSEQPVRHVTVKAFVMSRYPVTVGQWRECVRAGGCPDLGNGGDDDREPVNNVSGDDARRYVAWLSKATGRAYRLPTEAEWEYAARAGTDTRYWWGDQFSEEHATCRKCGSSHADPPLVGRYAPNAFGLYDMTGSVGQWVSDCWHRNYRGAPKDASSWGADRCREQVVRGGSWTSDPADQTVTSRSFYDPSVRHPSYGLRVVRSP